MGGGNLDFEGRNLDFRGRFWSFEVDFGVSRFTLMINIFTRFREILDPKVVRGNDPCGLKVMVGGDVGR